MEDTSVPGNFPIDMIINHQTLGVLIVCKETPSTSGHQASVAWNQDESIIIWRCPEIGVLVIINFNEMFPYKPSILGYLHFWKSGNPHLPEIHHF